MEQGRRNGEEKGCLEGWRWSNLGDSFSVVAEHRLGRTWEKSFLACWERNSAKLPLKSSLCTLLCPPAPKQSARPWEAESARGCFEGVAGRRNADPGPEPSAVLHCPAEL